MSLEDYITKNNYKPLTEKEISKGRQSLRIYGTSTPMPWNTIFARIESGQPLEEIGKQYGHARKIALFAQLQGIEVNPHYVKVVEDEVKSRQQIDHIANTAPETALTLLQRVNEVAPDFERDTALLGSKFIATISRKLDDKFIEATDIKALADAYQKTTDTVGVTQRHASAVNINTGDIKVTGFDFVLDAPPSPSEDAAVDAEVSDG